VTNRFPRQKGERHALDEAKAPAYIEGMPLSRTFYSLYSLYSFAGVIAVLAAWDTPAPAARAPLEPATAFVDVTVVPMDHERLLPHQTVVVVGERVADLGPVGDVTPPPGARIVDGRNRYLVPGLADMHVHSSSDSLELRLYLANGVTTIRDLNGSPRLLAWRDAIAAGRMEGPRLLVSGPLIAGPDVPWRNKVVPRSPEEGRAVVRAQKAAGYDYIKIYDGVPADVYMAVIDEARRQGMMVTGHIPQSVGLAGVLAAHQNLEHLDKIVFSAWGHAFDPSRIPSIADSIKRAGVWDTPTLLSMERLALLNRGKGDSLMQLPGVSLASSENRAYWTELNKQMTHAMPVNPAYRFNPFVDFQILLLRGLVDAGVPLLAGTDTPNAMLVPGYSLLDELDALADAGLSPYRVLEMATSNPARFTGGEAAPGIIERGRRADLLLLGANPLASLHALRERVGIMAGGKWQPTG